MLAEYKQYDLFFGWITGDGTLIIGKPGKRQSHNSIAQKHGFSDWWDAMQQGGWIRVLYDVGFQVLYFEFSKAPAYYYDMKDKILKALQKIEDMMMKMHLPLPLKCVVSYGNEPDRPRIPKYIAYLKDIDHLRRWFSRAVLSITENRKFLRRWGIIVGNLIIFGKENDAHRSLWRTIPGAEKFLQVDWIFEEGSALYVRIDIPEGTSIQQYKNLRETYQGIKDLLSLYQWNEVVLELITRPIKIERFHSSSQFLGRINNLFFSK